MGPEPVNQQIRAAQVRILEHGGQIEDLQDRADKHDLRFVKIDATLESLRCSPAALAIQDVGRSNQFSASVEVLELLAGQAKAVEDLDFLVREELRVGRQLAESAAQVADHPLEVKVADRLAEHVAEQSRAITELRDAVEDISSRVEQSAFPPPSRVEQSPSGSRMAPSGREILERVGVLEEQTASIQRNLVAVVAAVRQVGDHAADSLDDRVVAAMGEVHGRLASTIASL